MRGPMTMLLALCALTMAGEAAAAAKKKAKPAAPAPTVTIPRDSAAASPAEGSTTAEPGAVPYETVVVPAQSSSTPASTETAAAPATTAAPAPVVSVPVSSTASAAPASNAAPARSEGFGADTRYWTSLQVSGAAAVTDERPMPGEVATKVYERYVQSFSRPIPEKFDRDSFQSGSGSGGGK